MYRVPCAWVVALVGALILVTGCSSGSTSSAASSPSPPSTPAPTTGGQTPSDDVIALLEGRIAAWNRGDGMAAAAFYAEDAILSEEDNGLTTTGRAQIAARLQELIDIGFTLEAVGTPIQWGVLVMEPGNLILEGQPAALLMVFDLGNDGREIIRQWVLPAAPYD